MSKPNTITIDNVEYIRADHGNFDTNEDGLPYVVIRSRDQGVMTGYLLKQTPQVVTLLQARQIWLWESKFVLVEFAEFGPEGDGKVSVPLSTPFDLANWCGVYRCTPEAARKIRALPAYEPS